MATKLERYYKTIPSIYNPKNNLEVNGLLQAWAESDENITTQIGETRDQLFVAKADGKWLNYLGAGTGTARPQYVSLLDDSYRNLIVTMSYSPKQIRKAFYELLDVFWGQLYSRPNITNDVDETYDFGVAAGLTGTVTFTNGEAVIEGSGTLFTTELAVGDYVRFDGHENSTFARVVRILDNTTAYLGKLYDGDTATGAAKKLTPTILNVTVDGTAQSIELDPSYFTDTQAATVAELVELINEKGDDITAQAITNIFTQTQFLNLRTNTPGALGSIQVTGGTANTVLQFSTNKIIIETLDQFTVVYEINPNEVIVRVPELVGKLQRELKGALHIKSQYSGEIVNIDNLSKTIIVDLDDTVYTDLFVGAVFGQDEHEFTITGNTAGQNNVVLSFSATDDLSVLTGSQFIYLSGGALISWNVNHGLGQQFLNVTLYDVTTGEAFAADTLFGTDTDNIDITNTTSTDMVLATQQGTEYNFSVASSTWNVNHALSQQYVNVTVYDSTGQLIIPDSIQAVDPNNTLISFTTPQTGTAVVSADDVFLQSTPNTTWLIQHNLENDYPVVTVYDDSTDEVVTPDTIEAINENQLLVTFTSNISGAVVINEPPIVAGNTFVIMDPDYPGSYVYDTVQPFRISSQRTHLTVPVTAGDSLTTLTVDDASRIPNETGHLVISFGRGDEEQPIPILGRPNNTTLRIDPAYIFQNNHDVGEMVNFLDDIGANPIAIDGSDYPVYITGVREAILEFQSILEEVKAAGVRLRWDIRIPEYPFNQNYAYTY